MGRTGAPLNLFFAARWRLRIVWIPLVVIGIVLLTWNSDPRATAPWWALFLGEVLFVTGIMLPMLWLRRASAAYLEKAVPAKANNEEQD